MDAYVRWMDANVYNELLYLEWETAGRQDVRRLIALLEEMYREGGVKPNTFTLVLLDKITRELSADCFIKSELRLWAGMLDDISSFGWPISTIEALSKLKVQSI
jgi:hypothetical protein